MRRKIVITGLGPIGATGLGVDSFWEALCAGRSGLGPIERFDPSGFPSRLGGEVPELKVRDFVPKSYRKQTKVMARDTQLAVAAAKFAADDAGLVTRGSPEGAEGFAITPGRTGCQIGAGLIAAETEELSRAMATSVSADGGWDMRAWGGGEGGDSAMNNLPPLWLLKYLPNMLACHVTIIHGCEGPSNTITCAEASALLSIGEGARVIERGDADVCFSGGCESRLNLMGFMRMHLAGRAGATDGYTNGSAFVRPFDPDSPGPLMGEGGGIAILEESEHARGRGARAYAEFAGFGSAHSPMPILPDEIGTRSPEPIDRGLEHAMRAAIADAGISADAIDAIVPLGLGSPGLDAGEGGALGTVFGDRLGRIPLVTLCPTLGNTLAGQGGLMLAAAALAIHHQRLPARIHGGSPSAGLDAGPADARDAELGAVLACTHGLGGQCASVVLKRLE